PTCVNAGHEFLPRCSWTLGLQQKAHDVKPGVKIAWVCGGESAKFFLGVVVALLLDIKVDESPLKRAFKRIEVNELAKQNLLLLHISHSVVNLEFEKLDGEFIFILVSESRTFKN